MIDPPSHLTRAQTGAVVRARRGRNIALLVILIAIALLFYALAFVKLGGH